MNADKKFWYLACPYSHSEDEVRYQRYKDVTEASHYLWKAGVPNFSPITHSHPIAELGLPTGFDHWEPFDLAIIESQHCLGTIVLCLSGWKESNGVKAEDAYTRKLEKPVMYMEW